VGLLDKIRDGNNGADFPTEIADDLRDAFDADPAPGKRTRAPRTGADVARPTRRKVTPIVRKQVADEVEAYLLLGAGAWQMRDEHCGGALEKQAREIAERLAPILGKNAAIVDWLHTSGVIGDWAKLLMAIKPVFDAVREHHIVKSVQDQEDDGATVDATRYGPYRPGA
jgi:hypothetical protein